MDQNENYGVINKFMDSAVSELPAGERSDISIISSEAVDREGDVILQDGLNWEQWKAAGAPVSFAHDRKALPVGRGEWWKRKGNTTIGKTTYAPKPEGFKQDWMADAVFDMVKSGILLGKSIGFANAWGRTATPQDKRQYGAGCKRVIVQADVTEWAVVPVPCNAQAITQAVSKGLDPKFLAWLAPIAPVSIPVGPSVLVVSKAVNKALLNMIANLDLRKMIADGIDIRRGRV